MSNNLIIVDVNFNGIDLKMIADTGASKSIIFSIPQNDSIEVKQAKLITISGPGINEKVQGYLSQQNQLQVVSDPPGNVQSHRRSLAGGHDESC